MMKRYLEIIWKTSTLCGTVLFMVSVLCGRINEMIFMITGILLLSIPLICRNGIGENGGVVEELTEKEENMKRLRVLLEQFDDIK